MAQSDSVINGLKKRTEAEKRTDCRLKASAANLQLDDKQRTINMRGFVAGGGVTGYWLCSVGAGAAAYDPQTVNAKTAG